MPDKSYSHNTEIQLTNIELQTSSRTKISLTIDRPTCVRWKAITHTHTLTHACMRLSALTYARCSTYQPAQPASRGRPRRSRCMPHTQTDTHTCSANVAQCKRVCAGCIFCAISQRVYFNVLIVSPKPPPPDTNVNRIKLCNYCMCVCAFKGASSMDISEYMAK